MKYQPFALGAILREWLCQNDIEPEFPSARRNDGSATAQSGLRTSAAQTPRGMEVGWVRRSLEGGPEECNRRRWTGNDAYDVSGLHGHGVVALGKARCSLNSAGNGGCTVTTKTDWLFPAGVIGIAYRGARVGSNRAVAQISACCYLESYLELGNLTRILRKTLFLLVGRAGIEPATT